MDVFEHLKSQLSSQDKRIVFQRVRMNGSLAQQLG